MTELLPCPFCGGKAVLGSSGGQSEVDGYRRAHTVTCKGCGIHKLTFSKPYEGPPEDEAIASVIEAWNTRSYEDEYENMATDLGMQIVSLEARLSEAVKVLEEAKTWHEAQDKALSKQPPTHGPSGNQWARLQHREQIDILSAFLANIGEENEA